MFYKDNVLVEFCSLRIGPDRIAYLAHRPDWAGLDPTLAGLGPDWITKKMNHPFHTLASAMQVAVY